MSSSPGVARSLVLGLGLGLGLVACGSKGDGAPTAPNVKKTCNAANDGKQVTVVGYLATPMMVDPCGETCSVNLADTTEYTTDYLSLAVRAGSGPMTMKPLPTDLQFLQEVGADAFTVTDVDGKEQRVGTRVKVTGTLEAKKHLIDPLDGKPKIEALICTLRPATLRPF